MASVDGLDRLFDDMGVAGFGKPGLDGVGRAEAARVVLFEKLQAHQIVAECERFGARSMIWTVRPRARRQKVLL
jgi:hypothetical protein